MAMPCVQKRQASLDLLMLKLARRLGCQTYYDIDDAPRGLNPKRLANTEAMMAGVERRG